MGVWRNAILGVVTGDALGCPVQFESRAVVRTHPVTGMRGFGTFNLPVGSWTDDSSLTFATLASIAKQKKVDLEHIANNFVKWLNNGEYTPFGYAYDIGNGCYTGIRNYMYTKNPMSGYTEETNNGNGSLMRIMPVCLYYALNDEKVDNAVQMIEDASAITHGHKRAKIACGIYYFIVREIVKGNKPLIDLMQDGINNAFEYYKGEKELPHYNRIKDLRKFKDTDEDYIRSSGYVVNTMEAAVWCLINSESYSETTLKAVNLGGDTDTISAIAGGVAGLYYGVGGEKGIPLEWIESLQQEPWILKQCDKMEQ